VCRGYIYNHSAYVLCGVNTDITPQHWFCSTDREWTSFAQYYRHKKGIELAHAQQPMVVANQCNAGTLANVLPGTGTIIPGMPPPLPPTFSSLFAHRTLSNVFALCGVCVCVCVMCAI
jgi:hypothetical protein